MKAKQQETVKKSISKRPATIRKKEHRAAGAADNVLSLHHAVGNRAVQRLFESGTIQAKLTVGQPDDRYEQEADRVADEVMRMPELQVKRQTDDGNDEKLQQTKPTGDQITPTVQTKSGGEARQISSTLETNITTLQGGGQPLSKESRAFFEPRIGKNFAHVRVHADANANQLARSLDARAFTRGNDIVFGSGEYDSGSSDGKRLLGHELIHVVQQNTQEGNAIQRTVGDGHDLASEKFSGDAKLEAAYDNELFIRKGARGEHVSRIQGALVDRGYALPAFGVDGLFGSETERAVISYQSNNGLKVDGIVGPQTIGDLDAKFVGGHGKKRETVDACRNYDERDETAQQQTDRMYAMSFSDSGTSDWTVPTTEIELRIQLDAHPNADWVDRGRKVLNEQCLDEERRRKYMVIIVSGLGNHKKMETAGRVIETIPEDKKQMGREALTNLATNAGPGDIQRAQGYAKALLIAAGQNVPVSPPLPKDWLQSHTRSIGGAIKTLEEKYGASPDELGGALLQSYFVHSSSDVRPQGAGNIGHLPVRNEKIEADCDVYAAYGLRLMRDAGWDSYAFLAFQDANTPNTIAHAVGLARRNKNKGGKNPVFEYMMADSLQKGYLKIIGVKNSPEEAIRSIARDYDKYLFWTCYYQISLNGVYPQNLYSHPPQSPARRCL